MCNRTVCLIKALQIGELSVLGPINSYKSIIGLISAFIIIGEVPSKIEFLGVILIIYGSKFIVESGKKNFLKLLFSKKDIQLRFIALLFSGIEAGILKHVILMSSANICFYLWCFLGAIFSMILMFIFNKKPEKINSVQNYLITAISLAVMQISTNYVFKYMDVASVLALFQLSSIITLFLGFQMFHEHNMKRKLIGTVIMITGAILIILL